MSKNTNRRLGHDFERRVARILRVAFPGADVARGLQYRNPALSDVEGTPFRIECKKRKNKSELSYPALTKFLTRNAEEGDKYNDSRPGILITQLTGARQQLVHMTLATLVRIIEEQFHAPSADWVPLPEEEDSEE